MPTMPSSLAHRHRGLRVPTALVVSLAFVASALTPATAAPMAPPAKTLLAQSASGSLLAATKKTLTRTPTPKLIGTARVGSTLTAKPGSWAPAPVKLSYRWYRGASAITGATRSNYALTKSDAGKKISVRVTGRRTGYVTVTKASAARTVERLLTSAPSPKVTGTPTVGFTLTAQAGAWSPSPVNLTYRWYRGSTAIAGATRATYKLGAGDGGQKISVRVTGTRAGYTPATRASAAVSVARLLTSSPSPTISGVPAAGRTLAAVTGAWGPPPVTLTYQWLRNGSAISGATRSTYTLIAGDITRDITVRVTGSRAGYAPVTRTSASVHVLGTLTRTPSPTIHGRATVGSTMWGEPGEWDSGVALNFQWLREGKPIASATDPFYVITEADIAARLTLRVTGSRPGYTSVTRTSAASLPVAAIAIVTGVLTQDTAWTVQDNPVVVVRQLRVAAGATLTIGPGVVVKLVSPNVENPTSNLVVDGSLRIEGTAAQPVVVTALEDDTAGGDTNLDGADTEPYYDAWAYIEAHGPVSIAHADFRWFRGMYLSGTPTSITDSKLDLMRDAAGALFVYGSSRLTFERNTLHGLLSVDTSVATYSVRQNVLTPQEDGTAVHLDNFHPEWVSGNTATTDSLIYLGSGTLRQDWTLTRGGNLRYAFSHVTIAHEVQLLVEPGVTLQSTSIDVQGTLSILGAGAAPITVEGLEWEPRQCVRAFEGSTIQLEHVTFAGEAGCDNGELLTNDIPGHYPGTAEQVRITNSTLPGAIKVSGDDVALNGNHVQGHIVLDARETVTAISNEVVKPDADRVTFDISGTISSTGLANNRATAPGTMSVNLTIHGDWTLPVSPGANLAWTRASVSVVANPDADATFTVQAGTTIPGGGVLSATRGSISLAGSSEQPIRLNDVIIMAYTTLADPRAPHAVRGDHVRLTGASYVQVYDGELSFDHVTFAQTGDPGYRSSDYGTVCIYVAGDVFPGRFRGSLSGCDVGIHANTTLMYDARDVDWGPTGPGPVGSGPLAVGALLVSPWAGYVAPTVPTIPEPIQSSTALTCAEQLVVVARGSGEAPNGPVEQAVDSSLYDGFTYDPAKGGFGLDFRGMGMRLQELLTGETLVTDPWHVVNGTQPGLLDSLTPAQRNAMQVYALRYPATSVDVPMSAITFSKESPFLQVRPERLAEYIASILVGADSLRDLLTSQASRCPEQQFILAGYSQGAMVIHMALANLPYEQLNELAPRIDGVILLADPLRDPGDHLSELSTATEPGAGMVREAVKFPVVQALVDVWMDSVGGQSMTAPYPWELAARTVSICTAGDKVCDPTSGELSDDTRVAIHGYSTGQLPGWGRRLAERLW